MNTSIINLRSLKTRVTFITLLIILASNWILAINTNQVLRGDIHRLLGEHQFVTVTMAGEAINHELDDRMSVLKELANDISPSLLKDQVALTELLKKHATSQRLFNAGVVAYGLNGTALAGGGAAARLVGRNFADSDDTVTPLLKGTPTIGEPHLSAVNGHPEFVMSVPIYGREGQVVGVVAGITDLQEPNFLDVFSNNLASKSGSYMLVAPQYQLVVTATDKSRILGRLASYELDALLNRFVAGFKEAIITVDTNGVELLTSAKFIPVAGWYLVATFPTTEAFTPSQAMQNRILLHALSLTILVGVISWCVISHLLRRQLLPMITTAKTLHGLSFQNHSPGPLPITSHDEIADLIAAFNHLLATLARREQAHIESETRYRVMIEWSPDAITVHRHGRLIYVNPAAISLLGAHTAEDLLGLFVIDLIPAESQQALMARYPGVMENDCCGPMREGQCLKLDKTVIEVEVRSTAIMFNGEHAVHTVVRDITDRKNADIALQASLKDKVALLHEVHHRVKNNLQVIASLLRLEGGRSSQIETKLVLQEMQARVRSMALLHETLHRSGNFASVALADYLKELATQAFRAQATATIRLQLELSPVNVTMDQATPCGLLLNELISNCLKHGFPDGRRGEIRIKLSPKDASHWGLCVSDTGIGLSADFESHRQQTLGLQLVADLARQLGGTLEVGPGPQAVFTVIFPINEHMLAST